MVQEVARGRELIERRFEKLNLTFVGGDLKTRQYVEELEAIIAAWEKLDQIEKLTKKEAKSGRVVQRKASEGTSKSGSAGNGKGRGRKGAAGTAQP